MCNHMVHCSFCGLHGLKKLWHMGTCPNVSSLIFLVTNFCIIFCLKDSRKIGQYVLPDYSWMNRCRYKYHLDQPPGFGYTVARQDLICTHVWNHTTDIDAHRLPCLFLSIITVLDFSVYSLQNTCGLCISSVTSNKSHSVGNLFLVSGEHNWHEQEHLFIYQWKGVPKQDLNLILNCHQIRNFDWYGC